MKLYFGICGERNHSEGYLTFFLPNSAQSCRISNYVVLEYIPIYNIPFIKAY